MIENHPADRTEMPNFMDYPNYGPLLQINPKVVRLAPPGSKKGP